MALASVIGTASIRSLLEVKGHSIRAVSLYRSKFLDCLAGAVPNSYPTLDLLWDNVIARPWGTPRSTVLAQVPWGSTQSVVAMADGLNVWIASLVPVAKLF